MANKLLVAALRRGRCPPSPSRRMPPRQPRPLPRRTVEIDHMRFEPATLTIAAGNDGDLGQRRKSPHTVTDQGRVFRSAALDTKDRFSYTFATPGEFTYFCTLHPMMVGKIVVKPAGSSS